MSFVEEVFNNEKHEFKTDNPFNKRKVKKPLNKKKQTVTDQD